MCFEEIETEIFKILENSQTTNMKHIFLKILYYQLIFIYFMSVISHFKILLFFLYCCWVECAQCRKIIDALNVEFVLHFYGIQNTWPTQNTNTTLFDMISGSRFVPSQTWDSHRKPSRVNCIPFYYTKENAYAISAMMWAVRSAPGRMICIQHL